MYRSGVICCAISALLLIPLAALGQTANPEGFPEFSWDFVPVTIHVNRSMRDYTDEDLNFIARFPLIVAMRLTFEGDPVPTEERSAQVAQDIKKINPKAKVLFYWNVILDYRQNGYRASDVFQEHPEWHLTQKDGKPYIIRKRLPTYDLARPEVRAWWSDAAAEMVREGPFDGVFVDANIKVIADPERKIETFGKEKYETLRQGWESLLEMTRNKIGPGKIMLGNLLRAYREDCFAPYLKYFSGSYLENMEDPPRYLGMERKDYLLRIIEASRRAAQQGYIITVHLRGDPELDPLANQQVLQRPFEEREKLLREGITFPLAVYLVIAEKHTYFDYLEGRHTDKSVWRVWFPEYDRPLGPPKGPARRDGYIYTREFEHASVWVDIAHVQARIAWQREPVRRDFPSVSVTGFTDAMAKTFRERAPYILNTFLDKAPDDDRKAAVRMHFAAVFSPEVCQKLEAMERERDRHAEGTQDWFAEVGKIARTENALKQQLCEKIAEKD